MPHSCLRANDCWFHSNGKGLYWLSAIGKLANAAKKYSLKVNEVFYGTQSSFAIQSPPVFIRFRSVEISLNVAWKYGVDAR